MAPMKVMKAMKAKKTLRDMDCDWLLFEWLEITATLPPGFPRADYQAKLTEIHDMMEDRYSSNCPTPQAVLGKMRNFRVFYPTADAKLKYGKFLKLARKIVKHTR